MYTRRRYGVFRRGVRQQIDLEKLFKIGICIFLVITVIFIWSTSKAPLLNAAYVTMADSDEYADGAIALANSLRNVKSEYPLWVLTTGGVGVQRRTKLTKIPGVKIVPVDKIKLPENLVAKVPRWLNAFTKLRAFSLELDRIIWIDSDAIVTANIDELFYYPGGPSVLYAGIDPDVTKCDQTLPKGDAALNSGIMIIRPSELAFQRLMNSLNILTGNGLEYINDQDVLAYTFRYWKKLPYPEYGGHVVHCNCSGFYKNVKVLHFTAGTNPLQKPWVHDYDLKEYKDSTCVRNMYRTWSSMYYYS